MTDEKLATILKDQINLDDCEEIKPNHLYHIIIISKLCEPTTMNGLIKMLWLCRIRSLKTILGLAHYNEN